MLQEKRRFDRESDLHDQYGGSSPGHARRSNGILRRQLLLARSRA